MPSHYPRITRLGSILRDTIRSLILTLLFVLIVAILVSVFLPRSCTTPPKKLNDLSRNVCEARQK